MLFAFDVWGTSERSEPRVARRGRGACFFLVASLSHKQREVIRPQRGNTPFQSFAEDSRRRPWLHFRFVLVLIDRWCNALRLLHRLFLPQRSTDRKLRAASLADFQQPSIDLQQILQYIARKLAMPWQYHQRTGQLTWNGRQVATGYSGYRAGRNNPLAEQLRDIGPSPRGEYRIGTSSNVPGKSSVTMALSPVGHSAHGRDGFLIHGDSRAHPGFASHGCIVLDHGTRVRIATSGDRVLEVVE